MEKRVNTINVFNSIFLAKVTGVIIGFIIFIVGRISEILRETFITLPDGSLMILSRYKFKAFDNLYFYPYGDKNIIGENFIELGLFSVSIVVLLILLIFFIRCFLNNIKRKY